MEGKNQPWELTEIHTVSVSKQAAKKSTLL